MGEPAAVQVRVHEPLAYSAPSCFTPEELAWKLGNGKASLVVEPVPLFDRAVSAALDTLAARNRPGETRLAACRH